MTIPLIIGGVLGFLGVLVFAAGLMKSAGKADHEIEHMEPDDLNDEPRGNGCHHSWKYLGLDRDGNAVSECRKCGQVWEQ